MIRLSQRIQPEPVMDYRLAVEGVEDFDMYRQRKRRSRAPV